MAIGILISLVLAKVVAVATLATVAMRKKQSQNLKGELKKQTRKSRKKS